MNTTSETSLRNEQPKDTTITQTSILADTMAKLVQLKRTADTIGIFTVKDGNKWLFDANSRPVPKALYLSLWFENEVCILFADTNLGKSILAVQIAVQIAERYKVVYFDFELSDKQFENRYSVNYSSHYKFPDNFYRAEINPEQADYEGAGFLTVEDYLNNSIEKVVKDTGAKVVIIDNLTYLRTETEKSKDALPLMKHLKALKNKYGLSILCLAHTPKRDLSKPISRNDLAGSKMLINFSDSSFAIGESTQDKALRYIKQIKARNTEIEYDAENVAVFQLVKPDNFLHFDFIGYATEREHLKQVTEQDKESVKAKVIELKDAGKSLREIGVEMGISHMKVSRILKGCNTL